jgi:hypothetical protein
MPFTGSKFDRRARHTLDQVRAHRFRLDAVLQLGHELLEIGPPPLAARRRHVRRDALEFLEQSHDRDERRAGLHGHAVAREAVLARRLHLLTDHLRERRVVQVHPDEAFAEHGRRVIDPRLELVAIRRLVREAAALVRQQRPRLFERDRRQVTHRERRELARGDVVPTLRDLDHLRL